MIAALAFSHFTRGQGGLPSQRRRKKFTLIEERDTAQASLTTVTGERDRLKADVQSRDAEVLAERARADQLGAAGREAEARAASMHADVCKMVAYGSSLELKHAAMGATVTKL